ncbi:DEAD/DEAH box helicase [Synechococcus sp. J7-Johnson]|uniref:DEAD/DEAH box helicase n=1 Tax=Synechococcus sp. J7-Johnson TaxID=2823737 RepID=UPI0020CD91B5|nr:DEAD/DEAH box helicase [Synechococcus sp. J7-Johnson]MCP9840943.1 DEAD/DEAH box helicase [Synechococcus sp. J7-Johnson]
MLSCPASPACRQLASYFVDSGRVVPGLVVDPDGRLRAQWWPLPAAADRELLAAHLSGDSQEEEQQLAEYLADAVDWLVRRRLDGSAAPPPPPARCRRPGPATLPQAWLAALVGSDPHLAATADLAAEAAFVTGLHQWVREGAGGGGALQLCLRLHEPSSPRVRRWPLELLLRSTTDPSLMVPLAAFWDGESPFPLDRFDAVLAHLGLLTRLAPELAGLLEQQAPASLDVEEGPLLALLRQRASVLDEAGFGLLLPSWWRHGHRLGLRANTSRRSSTTTPAGEGAGLNLNALVSFQWQAVLGDRPLSTAELASLQRAAAAKRSLVRLRGEWTLIDPDAIASLLRHAGLEGEASGTELLHANLGLARLDLPDDLALVGVEASGPLGELIGGEVHSRATPIPTPADFEGELRPYQERGLGWLVFLGRLGLGACLADDMGLGKTAQLIATLLADPLEAPTLVVAPVSLLGNWSRELQRFAPQLPVLIHHGPGRFCGSAAAFTRQLAGEGGKGRPAPVLLTTYGMVSRDLPLLAEMDFGRLVFDEAQQLKNPYTAQSKAAAALRGERRIALTGTPVENRLSELWALMQLLNPGLLGSLRQFRDQFALPIERDHDAEVAARLQRLTAPFLLRRLKSDRGILPDLPGKIEQSEACTLSAEQASLYQAVVEELLAAAESSDGIERRGLVLAGLTRLKQVCNHPAHYLDDGSALPRRSGKLDRVEELIDAILDAGEKVLIFSQFAAWGERLRAHLQGRYGGEPLWLHGGLTRRVRDAMVQRFAEADGPPIFLLSLKAGGTGLNLTAAAHVIHFDRWWNPAVEDQATDRAHRIGQRRTVHVHKLVCSGTIEERIDVMIQSKRDLAERVVGTGEQWLTELSTAELREVISLRWEALTP